MTADYETIDGDELLGRLDARAADEDAGRAAALIRSLWEDIQVLEADRDAQETTVVDHRDDLAAARVDRDELVRRLRLRAADAYGRGEARQVELLDQLAAEILEVMSWL